MGEGEGGGKRGREEHKLPLKLRKIIVVANELHN